MTVGELKEKLEQFDDNLIVMVPDGIRYISAKNMAKGVNEFDGCIFIDDYMEED